MERKQSELTVITKAKDLCSYVMTVTQKSPKHFRFTFVTRLQNLALSVIENLFRANYKDRFDGTKRKIKISKRCFDRFKAFRIYCIVIYGTRLYSA